MESSVAEGDRLMDKKIRCLFLIHLLGLSSILFLWFLLLDGIHLFNIILIVIIWEIIVNLKYPIDNFPKYYSANALGVLIFMSIIVYRQIGETWFQWQWLLNYNGLILAITAPLFGYGIRRILTDKKQSIYLAHIFVPGMIMLITKIATNNSIPGGVLIPVVVIIIIWQAVGSTGITNSNFWKYYLANFVGLILLVMVFSLEQLFLLSLPAWIDENLWLLDKIWFVSLIGSGIGLIGRTKPIDDGQGPIKN